jgi:hypothetical protein
MGLLADLVESPANFLGERKEIGLAFTWFCFERHLNITNGRSSDYFRVNRPFGIYPVVFNSPAVKVRSLLTLLLSCWRWAYEARGYPQYCEQCDSLVNSHHLLFHCVKTQTLRDRFLAATGTCFRLESLQSTEHEEEILSLCNGVVKVVTGSV